MSRGGGADLFGDDGLADDDTYESISTKAMHQMKTLSTAGHHSPPFSVGVHHFAWIRWI
jgi:hypothetical protein